MDENKVTLHVDIDMSEMDEVTRKAERLNELLERASSIVDELAAKGSITLSVDVEDTRLDAKSLARAAVEAIDGMSANK